MESNKTLLTQYFMRFPLHLRILEDKACGLSEKELANKYQKDKYSIHKIRRLCTHLGKLFGRCGWEKTIWAAKDLELISLNCRPPAFPLEKPTPYLVSTMETNDDKQTDIRFEKENKDWDKKKKELGWQ
jgi:hypothetical protein